MNKKWQGGDYINGTFPSWMHDFNSRNAYKFNVVQLGKQAKWNGFETRDLCCLCGIACKEVVC